VLEKRVGGGTLKELEAHTYQQLAFDLGQRSGRYYEKPAVISPRSCMALGDV